LSGAIGILAFTVDFPDGVKDNPRVDLAIVFTSDFLSVQLALFI
jgi:hypothetical protein